MVASYDGSIRALDAQDGSTRWTHNFVHPFIGRALARVGDSIIAEAADGYVVAFGIEDGAVHWETTLPDTTLLSSPDTASVVSSSTQVVVQAYHQCFFLDVSDGHIVWRGAPPIAITMYWWVLAVGEGNVYVLSQERHPRVPRGSSGSRPPMEAPDPARPRLFAMTALSTWDGTPQWSTREYSAVQPPWDSSLSLVEADGVVYTYGYGLHALEAATGRLLWSREDVPRATVGALAIRQNEVIVAAGEHLGAYRRDTGAPVWGETVPPRTDSYYEGFDGVLAIDDMVYAGHSSPTQGYRVEARAGSTGAVQWIWPRKTEDSPLRSDISWRFRGDGGILYIPSRDGVWGVDAVSGTPRWHHAYPPEFPEFTAFLAVRPLDH